MKKWVDLFKAVSKFCLYLFGILVIILIPVGVFLVALYSLLVLIITYVPGILILGMICFGIILATIWGAGKE